MTCSDYYEKCYNYQLWLKNYVISDIAKHIYGWTESSNIIFGVEGCGTLLEKLNKFKKNKDKTLIYIVNKDGNHWVTLVAIHTNEQEDVFFYADSFGVGIEECRVNAVGRGKIDSDAENKVSYGNKVNQYSVDCNSQNIEENSDDIIFVEETAPLKQDRNDNIQMSLDEFLEREGYSKNNIHSVSCNQQYDKYNCGVFALGNAKAILNAVKDGDDDPAKVKESLKKVNKRKEDLNISRRGFVENLKKISNSTVAKKSKISYDIDDSSQNLFSQLMKRSKSEKCRVAHLKDLIEKFIKKCVSHYDGIPLSMVLLGQLLCESEDRKDTYKSDKYILSYPENKNIAFLLSLYDESFDKAKFVVLNVIKSEEKASKKDDSTLDLIPKVDVLLSDSDELEIFYLKKGEVSYQVNAKRVSMCSIKEGSEVKCVPADKMVISTDLLRRFTDEIGSRKEVIDKLGEVFSRAARMGSVLMKDQVDCQAVFAGLLMNYCNKVSLIEEEGKLIISNSIGPDVPIWLNKNTANSLDYSFFLEQQENGTQAKSSYISNSRSKGKKKRENYYAFLRQKHEVSFFRSDIRGDRAISHNTAIYKGWARPPIIIDEKDYGCNPLHLAILENNADCIEKLILADKAYIEGRDDYGNTPLHFAVQKSKLKAFEVFMSCIEKHDQNQKEDYVKRENDQGETPLHLAARSGKAEVVNKLLDLIGEERRGDYVRSKNGRGETLLHFAVRSGSIGVVEKLLQCVNDNDKEGYVKSKNTNKCTPLHFAAESDSVEVINKLLEFVSKGAKEDYVKSKNDKGDTPLHFAAKKSSVEVILSLTRCVTEEQKKQKYVMCKNNLGYTPLHLAAGSGNVEVVNKLLEFVSKGAKEDYVKSKNNEGETPLHFAARSSNVKVVQKLLEYVNDKEGYVRSESSKKETSLHFAARGGNVEVINKLLEFVSKEAKEDYVKSKNNKGETPLHFAARSSNVKVVQKLLEFINDKERYVRAENSEKETSLHFAARGGNVEVINKLLEFVSKEAKEDYIKSKSNKGETPLHFAVKSGNVKVVQKLLEFINDKEGYVRAENSEKETSLHFAARGGNVEVINKLLEFVSKGAKEDYVKSKNNKGETPLHFAAKSNNVQVVQKLLQCVREDEKGNYIKFVNNGNKNALDIAISYGNMEVFYELLQYIEDQKQHYLNLIKQAGGSEKRNVHNSDNLQTKGCVKERKMQRNSEALTSQYSKKRPRISDGTTQKPPVKKVAQSDNPRQNIEEAKIESSAGSNKFYNHISNSHSSGYPNKDDEEGASESLNNVESSGFNSQNNCNNSEHDGVDEKSSIHLATLKNDIVAVKDLIHAGVDVNALDSSGYSSLHLASQKDLVEIAKLLIDEGADVDIKAQNNYCFSAPLHYAYRHNSKNVIKLLVKNGASIFEPNQRGLVPAQEGSGSRGILRRDSDCSEYNYDTEYDIDSCTGDEHISSGSSGGYSQSDNNDGFDGTSLEDMISLHFAVECNNKSFASVLLERDADVNATDQKGRTPLYIALENDRKSIVRTLLKAGADIDQISSDQLNSLSAGAEGNRSLNIFKSTKSLFSSILNGEKVELESYIKGGAIVNATDQKGRTPLHVAVEYNRNDIVSPLLERDADVNATDQKGRTPLYIALENDRKSIVRTLLREGADIDQISSDQLNSLSAGAEGNGSLSIFKSTKSLFSSILNGEKVELESYIKGGAIVNATDQKGRTPLHVAVEYNRNDIVSPLLERDADVNATDQKGRTPLHVAVEYNRNDIVSPLLERDADVNATDQKGRTPLHVAVEYNRNDIVSPLLERDADVNATDQKGRTPLHVAVEYNRNDIVSPLLERDADVNATDQKGRTPLHVAVEYNRNDIVSPLLERDADVNATDQKGRTPLHVAVEYNRNDIVSPLLERDADVNATDQKGRTPLHVAAQYDCEDAVSPLLERDADVNATDQKGRTPLHVAVEYNHNDIVSTLLERDADVNATDQKDRTPLHVAAEYNCNDIVSTLLKKDGVDVNAKDQKGRTPLRVAVRKSRSGVIEDLLKQAGVNANATDLKGRVPLHIVAEENRYQAVKLLTSKGDVNAQDKDGWTPLHVAVQKGNEKVTKALLEVYGINVDIKNKDGKTPLNLAEKKWKQDSKDINLTNIFNLLHKQVESSSNVSQSESQLPGKEDDKPRTQLNDPTVDKRIRSAEWQNKVDKVI